jgi:hypothetical protein
MMKYEFKEATEERKQELLSSIICNYNVANRSEMVQALGHCQGALGCSQEEFSSHPLVGISTRQLRTHKKDYLDLYTASFEKYSDAPEMKNVEGVIDENVMETVYENLLARLKSPKSATKDIAVILEYFGIGKDEFKKFTDFRNATLRGFMSDNLSQIVTDEKTVTLIKSVIAESQFLYQGTEKTVGNTHNSMTMDLGNPLVRLECQTLGLLLINLFNGKVTDAFVNHAETLRLLKLVSGDKGGYMGSYHLFDRMDGKIPSPKPLSPDELQRCIYTFGKDEGEEMYNMLLTLSKKVDKKTSIPMPRYEDVSEDYELYYRDFPEMSQMPFRVLLARLDAHHEKLKDKYKQYITEITED